MQENLRLTLNTIDEWLKKETIPIIDPLRDEAKKTLEETQTKFEELLDANNRLLDDAEKEIAKGSRKTYRRAKLLIKLTQTFSDLIENLTIPEEINGETLKQVSEEIEKILKTINKEKTKWFRAISPYFIISRRRFDISLKRVDDSFQSFNNFLLESYSKAESAENVFFEVENLQKYLMELSRLKIATQNLEEQKRNLESNIEKIRDKLESIQNENAIIESKILDERINEFSEKVKYELHHIQKPLLKFQSLVKSRKQKLMNEANSKLDEYLIDPFNALASEKEGYPLLKIILQKINSALDNKKMKLKLSRLRKAKDQIDNILNKEALLSIQFECKEIFNKKRELTNSEIIHDFNEKREKLVDTFKTFQRQKKILEARYSRLRKKEEEIRERINTQKDSVEKIIYDLSNKNVQIVINK